MKRINKSVCRMFTFGNNLWKKVEYGKVSSEFRFCALFKTFFKLLTVDEALFCSSIIGIAYTYYFTTTIS